LFSKYGDLIKVNKVKLAEIVLNKQSLELEVNVKQDEISAINQERFDVCINENVKRN
jgi:hypothetical protein